MSSLSPHCPRTSIFGKKGLYIPVLCKPFSESDQLTSTHPRVSLFPRHEEPEYLQFSAQRAGIASILGTKSRNIFNPWHEEPEMPSITRHEEPGESVGTFRDRRDMPVSDHLTSDGALQAEQCSSPVRLTGRRTSADVRSAPTRAKRRSSTARPERFLKNIPVEVPCTACGRALKCNISFNGHDLLLKKDLQSPPQCVILIIACSGKQAINESGSLVKWLRRRPLTAETGVRLPYELRLLKQPDP